MLDFKFPNLTFPKLPQITLPKLPWWKIGAWAGVVLVAFLLYPRNLSSAESSISYGVITTMLIALVTLIIFFGIALLLSKKSASSKTADEQEKSEGKKWKFTFSSVKIPWRTLLALAAVIYFGHYYLYGRQEVLVTHYLVAGAEGECNEDNAIGDITSFALRRWESERFTVPNGHRRCYYPLNRLDIKTQDPRRVVHIVSLR